MRKQIILAFLLSLFQSSAQVELVFNGFDPSSFLLFSGATFQSVVPGGTRYLLATNGSRFSAGRGFWANKIKSRESNRAATGNSSGGHALPFYASFVFSIARISGVLPGHGITFLFSPVAELEPGTEAQQLGLFNFTTNTDPSNGVLAVEFDVFENAEFNDIDNNHVGVDVYSLTSVASHTAGYHTDGDDSGDSSSSTFVPLTLNDGTNYQAWVDYADERLNVTMAVAGSPKPSRPLISVNRDLSSVFEDEMFAGFSASTGRLVENHWILGWSFSHTNSSLSRELVTSGLPSFVTKEGPKSGLKTALIASVTSALATLLVVVGVVLHFVCRRRRRKEEEGRDELGEAEEWEVEYWPHRIGYGEILTATKGFSDDNLIGCGGNGKVYRGTLAGAAVAVKLFSGNAGEEARGFLAEVSSLGRLRHRNLVGLKGWCRRQGGDLILVYEYMDNRSLDKRIFADEADGEDVAALDWKSRMRILKDVAAGVLYLHEGWESKVVHRDIKSSNVMLDGDMVGRLGDFGLARIHLPGDGPRTTKVVGTVGYMAPEVMRSGKATVATDVYGFGVVVLEVVFGRRPVVEGAPELIEVAWEAAAKGAVADAVDQRVKRRNGFELEEAERMVRLGLLCTVAEAARRPTMRQVVRALEWGMIEDGGVEESADGCLIEKLKAATMARQCSAASPRYPWQQGFKFDELRQQMSGSVGLSSSDLILVGR